MIKYICLRDLMPPSKIGHKGLPFKKGEIIEVSKELYYGKEEMIIYHKNFLGEVFQNRIINLIEMEGENIYNYICILPEGINSLGEYREYRINKILND